MMKKILVFFSQHSKGYTSDLSSDLSTETRLLSPLSVSLSSSNKLKRENKEKEQELTRLEQANLALSNDLENKKKRVKKFTNKIR